MGLPQGVVGIILKKRSLHIPLLQAYQVSFFVEYLLLRELACFAPLFPGANCSLWEASFPHQANLPVLVPFFLGPFSAPFVKVVRLMIVSPDFSMDSPVNDSPLSRATPYSS